MSSDLMHCFVLTDSLPKAGEDGASHIGALCSGSAPKGKTGGGQAVRESSCTISR